MLQAFLLERCRLITKKDRTQAICVLRLTFKIDTVSPDVYQTVWGTYSFSGVIISIVCFVMTTGISIGIAALQVIWTILRKPSSTDTTDFGQNL
jgi:hypothetical protein